MAEQIIEPDVVETPDDEQEQGEGVQQPAPAQTLALAVYEATPGGDIKTNIDDIIHGVQELLADNKAFDIQDAAGLRYAKAVRADIRKARKAINDQWIDIKDQYERPLRDFQIKVKQATGPLDLADTSFKEAIDAYGRRLQGERERFLADYYEDLAPDIAELVPFKRFIQIRGEKGARGDVTWLRTSMGEIKARDAMEAELVKVAEEWTALGGEANGDQGELDRLRAIYAECLDYGETLKRRSMERQREQQIRKQREAEEAWKAQAQAQSGQQSETPPPFDDLPFTTPGEAPEPEPAPTPEPAQAIRWHVTLDSYITATVDEAKALGALLKANGLTGGHITRVKEDQ